MREFITVIIISFMVSLPVSLFLVNKTNHDAYVWGHAPCSHFVNYKLGDMPVRCIKAYQK